jgi:hypothetical protein
LAGSPPLEYRRDLGSDRRLVMSDHPTLPSRRALLLAGGALLTAGGLLVGRHLRAQANLRDAERRLVAGFVGAERIGDVGRRYLKLHPEENDRERLVELLIERIGTVDRSESQARLRERIATAVRSDFSEERTVRVASWLLSRTEARLAALAVLQPAATG